MSAMTNISKGSPDTEPGLKCIAVEPPTPAVEDAARRAASTRTRYERLSVGVADDIARFGLLQRTRAAGTR
jgi:hypothetical protein